MSREGTLIKNTAIITIGKICTQMISFFLLPLYTAMLTKEEYGVVDLLNTLVSLLLPIITFQVEQAVFRYLIDVRENEEDKKRIISTTMISVTIQSIVYLAIFLLLSNFIHNEYKFFLATNVVACVYSSVMLQISRGLGDNKTYAVGSFITAIATIIFNIIFIVGFNIGAYGMLLARLIANIMCALYIGYKNRLQKYIKIASFGKDTLKKLWKYSMPLIPNALSWWIFNSSDRIIVSSILGLGANGILAAAHKFPSVYITIYNIFNMTWTETAALHIDDADNSDFFSKISNKVYAIFSCICFGIIAAMPFVFPIMVNESYSDAYNQIPILMLGSLANVGVGLISVIYVAKKKTKEIAKTSVMSAAINIVAHLILIKFVGLYAASLSTFIAYASMLVYRYFDVKKYVTLKLDKGIILSSVVMILVLLFGYYTNNLILNIGVLILTIAYSLILNKDNITFILKMFQNKMQKRSVENE